MEEQYSTILTNQQSQQIEENEFINPEEPINNLDQDQNDPKHISLIDHFFIYTNFNFTKLIALILTIQGLKGLYKSIVFILIDYPSLEQAMRLGQISGDQINNFASKAIVMITTTIISMAFAMRLSTGNTSTIKKAQTSFGIFLIFANAAITNYLSKIGSIIILGNFLDSIVNLIH